MITVVIDVTGPASRVARQVHQAVVAGPSGHLVGAVLAAFALGEQHFHGLADLLLHALVGDQLLHRDQPLVALGDDRRGDLVG